MVLPGVRVTVVALLAGAVACASGCLKRTISITTEPEGALVWLNDVEVGRTPLETDFTFYGNYDVRIRREGYEPILTNQKANAPVHEWPGIDLVAEALPVRFHNVVRWHWVLTPVAESGGDKAAAEAAFIERARAMRTETVPLVGPMPEQPAAPDPAPETPAEPSAN